MQISHKSRLDGVSNGLLILGNDFQNWATEANDAVILAIADGIKSVDTNHLMTIELNYPVSESQDDPNWILRI